MSILSRKRQESSLNISEHCPYKIEQKLSFETAFLIAPLCYIIRDKSELSYIMPRKTGLAVYLTWPCAVLTGLPSVKATSGQKTDPAAACKTFSKCGLHLQAWTQCWSWQLPIARSKDLSRMRKILTRRANTANPRQSRFLVRNQLSYLALSIMRLPSKAMKQQSFQARENCDRGLSLSSGVWIPLI